MVRDAPVRESKLLASHWNVRPPLSQPLVKRYAQSSSIRRECKTILVLRPAPKEEVFPELVALPGRDFLDREAWR